MAVMKEKVTSQVSLSTVVHRDGPHAYNRPMGL